jgi:hypothetical protein
MVPEVWRLTFATGCVLAAWAGLFLLFAGLGLGLLRAACGRAAALPGLVPCCWLGYAAAIALLQIWHLFLPVDGRALAALAGGSVAGWLAGRAPRRAASPRPSRAVVLSLGGLGLWLADRSIGPCAFYDSANYQLPIVRWLHQFAIVPGLANLNPLYGHNSSGLLFPALLEQGPGAGRSYHVCHGFLLLLLFLLLVPPVARMLRASSLPRPHQIAAALLLFPALALVTRGNGVFLSSHATDIPATLTVFAALVLVLEAFDGEENGPLLFSALALLAVAPCLKSIVMPFSLTAWVLILGATLLSRRSAPARSLRPVVCTVLFAAATLLAWLVRSVILSGYPLYPSTFAALNVDWRLPIEYPQGILWWIRSYSRAPEAWDLMTQAGTGWLSYWLRVELRAGLLDAILPLALTGAWLLVWLLARRPRLTSSRHFSILLISLLLSIVLWFFLAPAVRFGMPLFWCLCAQTGAAFLPPVLARLPSPRPVLGTAVALTVVSSLVLPGYYAVKYRGSNPPAAALKALFFTAPGPDHGFHPLPTPALRTATVCGGLQVLLPAAEAAERNPAPWQETVPWSSPPPSTAALLDGLCPRAPGDPAAGFRLRTDGRSWPERNAQAVSQAYARTGWSPGRLAVYFFVRPELIGESLQIANAWSRDAHAAGGHR